MIDSLQTLILNKDTTNIAKLIEENPNVLEMRDKNRSSGFMLLAYSGLSTVFEKAIEMKSTFSFHEAIVAGKMPLLKDYSISEIRSLSNKHSDDGFSPLSLAVFFDQSAIAIFLLENGADPNLHATNPSKVNALHSAVAKENYELCLKLIEAGANVNAVQQQNVTALHAAVHRGNFAIVKLLAENGANLASKMDNGDTPISIARRDKHFDVLAYLEQLKE